MLSLPKLCVSYSNHLARKVGPKQLDESIDDTFVSLGAGHGDVPTTVQATKAGAVFTSLKLFSDIPFPLSPLDAAPPVLTTNPPVEDLIVADPDLKLPRTYQWNIAVEQSLGSSQSLSLTYVGALGRDLLRQTALNPAAGGNSNVVYVYPIDNTATSDYDALQVKFQRRLSRGLQALASYSFSHSIDISSTDAINYVTTPDAVSNPNIDRGDSDFDIRHSFTAGVTYDLPAPRSDKVVHAILGDWSLDSFVMARSAPPVDIIGAQIFASGATFMPRPNVVPGVPLVLYGSQYPGGKGFNPAAFRTPPTEASRVT